MPIVVYDNQQLKKLFRKRLSLTQRIVMLQSLIDWHAKVMHDCHRWLVDNNKAKANSVMEKQSLTYTGQQLLKRVTICEQYIKDGETAKLATKKLLKDARREYSAVRKFLGKLKHDARGLFDTLFDNIYKEIFDYELNHALAQTEAERIFWHETKRQLLSLPETNFFHPDGEPCTHNASVSRCRFALLGGFLWEMFYRANMLKAQEGIVIDFPFEALLEATHIAEARDLPSPHELGMSCRDFFQQNRQPFIAITSNDLYELEQAEYHVALLHLHNANGDLAEPVHAMQIAACIEKKVSEEFIPDLKFYTLVLKLAYGCLQREPDLNCVTALKILAELAPGARSKWGYLANAATGLTTALGMVAYIYASVVNDAYFSPIKTFIVGGTLLANSMFVATQRLFPISPTGVSQAMHAVVEAGGEPVLTQIFSLQ